MAKSFRADEAAPSKVYRNVTKSDSVEYIGVRTLYVGSGGDVVTMDNEGNLVTHRNVPSGIELGISPVRIMAASTASDFVIYF
jgi:hypothetical protein